MNFHRFNLLVGLCFSGDTDVAALSIQLEVNESVDGFYIAGIYDLEIGTRHGHKQDQSALPRSRH